MKISLNSRDFYHLFICVILSVFIVIEKDSICRSITYACIVANTVSLYIIVSMFLSRKDKGIVSFVFSIIYHACAFGRVSLVYLFKYKSEYYFDTFNRFAFTEKELSTAVYLCTLCFIGVFCGTLISIKSRGDTLKDYDYLNRKSLLFTANILGVITVLPSILDFINEFSKKYTNGSLFTGNVATSIGILSDMFCISIIIWVLLLNSNRIDYLFLVYFALQLVLGGRGKPICMIVTILILRHIRYGKGLKKKNVILVCLGVFLGTALFATLARTRSRGWEYLSQNFLSVFIESLFSNNPLFEIEYELGVALAPLIGLMRYCPSVLNYQYGMAILYSFFCMIPDAFGIVPVRIKSLGNIATIITNVNSTSYGASIVQDFYFNFGMLAPVFIIPAGVFIRKVSDALRPGNKIKTSTLVFLSALIYPILWWPRSSLGYFSRYIGTVILIPFIMNHIIKTIMRHR